MRNIFHYFQEGNKHLIFVFFLMVSRVSHSFVYFYTFFREFFFFVTGVSVHFKGRRMLMVCRKLIFVDIMKMSVKHIDY